MFFVNILSSIKNTFGKFSQYSRDCTVQVYTLHKLEFYKCKYIHSSVASSARSP